MRGSPSLSARLPECNPRLSTYQLTAMFIIPASVSCAYFVNIYEEIEHDEPHTRKALLATGNWQLATAFHNPGNRSRLHPGSAAAYRCARAAYPRLRPVFLARGGSGAAAGLSSSQPAASHFERLRPHHKICTKTRRHPGITRARRKVAV